MEEDVAAELTAVGGCEWHVAVLTCVVVVLVIEYGLEAVRWKRTAGRMSSSVLDGERF